MSAGLLIISTLIIVYIQAAIYKRWGLKGVTYSRSFGSSNVFEGEDVQMIEIISNHKLIPILWLQLESEIDPHLQFQKQANLDIKHQHHRSFFSIMPFTRITRKHTLKCSKRGFYSLKSAVLSCNDAFNIVQTYEELTLDASILVYPKIIPIDNIKLSCHSWMGDTVVRRWIIDDPFMISGIKDYQYGDSMNRIDWKSTARTGSIKVYNRDYTSNMKIIILLNIQSNEDSWDDNTDVELMENAISYCASIASYMMSKSIETGFCCNCHSSENEKAPVLIPAGCSAGHINLLLESMAMMQLKRSVMFQSFMDNLPDNFINNADFLVVTNYVDAQIEKSIQRIKDVGCAVEILSLEEK
ncbi:DUF58 domain-containing protein [Pseudobacteroides cellulosolvens]|uniref:DUF58 domain-containing protein n=1 Tax=Pseudobacteroides cellulosolvens ATCC 35603 = DSM 2933 TaxID=398512 RepID=A0A0L6JU05_9FIRM|nr:DUF58 domain-containing protein [Pseudobacteroides cellulosolvens]KNY29160.1 protein of unknown function DUF58 [Pseudobacteroides cellulosolvens ATCC 35603 = DSM 2933]